MRGSWFTMICLTVLFHCTGCSDGLPIPSQFAGGYQLSQKARRVSDLIDRKSYSAAEQMLLNYLEKDTTDPGMCVQFCRYYLLTRDIAEPGFVVSPFRRDKMEYSVQGEVTLAFKLAIEQDSKIASYASDAAWRSLATRMEEVYAENRGVVGTGNTLLDVSHGKFIFYDGFQLSLTNAGWAFLPESPETAKRWASVFEEYAQRYATKGKVASALALGNLAGDMSQGGIGNRDYVLGTKYLYKSLQKYDWNSDLDWVKLCVEDFPVFFRDELIAFQNGETPDAEFQELKKRLAEHGYTIAAPSEETRLNQVIPTGAVPK